VSKDPLDPGPLLKKPVRDFADEYPSAEVIGTDLSPIQPSFVPPNLRFEIDDATESWVYSQEFDLVHVRSLYGAIADWPAFYREALKYLALSM
jgi:hypothetical protein